MDGLTGSLEQIRPELLSKEFVAQPLIDQQPLGPRRTACAAQQCRGKSGLRGIGRYSDHDSPLRRTGVHRSESRTLSRVPRFNYSEEETRASMAAFEERTNKLGARVIIQHEPADIAPLGGVIR